MLLSIYVQFKAIFSLYFACLLEAKHYGLIISLRLTDTCAVCSDSRNRRR